MLVLVSFGLVLLATILLVVGLLSDDGLTLIYFSIASSFTAAIVLYLAFRLSRPKAEPTASAPEPLDDALVPTEPAATAPAATAPAPARAPAPAPAAPPEPAVAEPEPAAVEPEPPVTTDSAPAAEDWVDDDDWARDEDWAEVGEFEVEFPIAEYDDLTVSEIMPLLPQLYSDELEIVAERERSGKNRTTILDRLAELAQTGTEADRLEQQAEDAAAEPEVALAAGSPEPEPAPAVPDAPTITLHDEDDDLDYVFPIAEYDDLTVAQIMPLLAQLELDELEEVKEREVAGQARKSLITEIDRYLSGELEVAAWDDDEEELAPVAPSVPAAPAGRSSEPGLPIADYDQLNVADIRPQLSDLSNEELRVVRDHEAARDNRKTIIDEIDRRLSSAAAATETPVPQKRAAKKAASKKRAAKKAASTKRATKKTGTKKRGAKKSASTKRATKKSTAKKATTKKAAKKAASRNNRFPIADYDELTVAQIRPRLGDLSDRQLEQVRERERAGRGRKTVLDDIDNRLS